MPLGKPVAHEIELRNIETSALGLVHVKKLTAVEEHMTQVG